MSWSVIGRVTGLAVLGMSGAGVSWAGPIVPSRAVQSQEQAAAAPVPVLACESAMGNPEASFSIFCLLEKDAGTSGNLGIGAQDLGLGNAGLAWTMTLALCPALTDPVPETRANVSGFAPGSQFVSLKDPE